MKTLWHTLFVLTSVLLLAACGSGESTSTDGGDSSGDGETAAVNYAFSVSFDDSAPLTQDNAEAKVPAAPGVTRADYNPAFEIDGNQGIDFLRIEFAGDELAVGEVEVRRALATFTTDISGESVQVGCGSNDGTPDDAAMTITDVTDEGLTGSLSITLISCNDYITAEAVDLESITVTGEFTNVPYLPEE